MNLKQWRAKKKLTMAAAAEVLGVTQPTISRVESGEHLPKRSTIMKLMDRSGGAITASDLYRHWEAAKPAVSQ